MLSFTLRPRILRQPPKGVHRLDPIDHVCNWRLHTDLRQQAFGARALEYHDENGAFDFAPDAFSTARRPEARTVTFGLPRRETLDRGRSRHHDVGEAIGCVGGQDKGELAECGFQDELP